MQQSEARGHGRIAPKENLSTFALDDVAVVTAMTVMFPASAPVIDLKSLHSDIAVLGGEGGPIAPAQFGHCVEMSFTQQIAGGFRRNDPRGRRQTAQPRKIEM